MDALDVVIDGLIKAASTEFVKRGLDSISVPLKKVFASGNKEEIKQAIINQNLIEPVVNLAVENINRSYIIPFSTPKEALPVHKVQLFREIIKFGFELSRENKMDIILPGSFLGTKSASFFSASRGIPDMDISGVTLNLSTTPGEIFCILPFKDDADASTYFEAYKKNISKYRLESDDYINIKSYTGEKISNFAVSKLTAGSLYLYFQVLFTENVRSLYGLSEGDRAAPLSDYADGINLMLESASQIRDLAILPEKDGLQISRIAEMFEKIYKIN